MDIEQRSFDDDFFAFRQTIKELERRIAALLA
jgi:dynein heavy chain